MNSHELTDTDSDALTITTQGDRTWVTCTSGDSEVTVGPFTTDPMDGGVTAAMIEKEAEPTDVWRRRAEKAEDTLSLVQQQRDQATARAEQAERERDYALRRAKNAADQADDALGMAAYGECHDCIRDAAVIREPLTPEVTDETVRRAKLAAGRLGWFRRFDAPGDEWKQVLTAALTEPPRPEGAEELEDLLLEDGAPELLGAPGWLPELADHLAERGVRAARRDEEKR